jgi:hypothetical protein
MAEAPRPAQRVGMSVKRRIRAGVARTVPHQEKRRQLSGWCPTRA